MSFEFDVGAGQCRPALTFWRYVMKSDPLVATPLEEYLNALGHEQPNPTPVAPPVGFKKQPSMVEHLREMVRSELLRREVDAAGAETFAEADDFEIEDDPVDPHTPFEAVFDPAPVLEPAPVDLPAPSPAPGQVPVSPAAPVAPVVVAAPAKPVASTPT